MRTSQAVLLALLGSTQAYSLAQLKSNSQKDANDLHEHDSHYYTDEFKPDINIIHTLA